MNYLLWTDPHFTDADIDNYRWDVFKHLVEIGSKYKVDSIVCLGDLVDRKDRHSSRLVNRLIEEFSYLQSTTCIDLSILSGNHDKPLQGPYYWNFLDKLRIRYITKPELIDNVWFLPFSPNPILDWEKLDLGKADALFMHQTVAGAVVDGDREIPSAPHPMPQLPAVPIFSGDVHRPQFICGITYIGVPHPIRYSETWPNRLLVIEKNNFKKPIECWIPSIKKAIIDITSSKQMEKLNFKEGDQIRVRYTLDGEKLPNWPSEQEVIKQWGETHGVRIASIEAVLAGGGVKVRSTEEAQKLEVMKPDEIIRSFGASERLNPDVIEMGIELLKHV